MKQLLVFLLLLCSASVSAQDVIVKKDGSTIVCRVVELTDSEITYKKWSDLNGSNYVMNRADASAINYEDGKKVSLSEATNLYKPSNQNDGTQQYNDRALLALDASLKNPVKTAKNWKKAGWISGCSLVGIGAILLGQGIGGDDDDSLIVGIAFCGVGITSFVTCSQISKHYKKKVEKYHVLNLYQNNFPITNSTSLSFGADLLCDRTMGNTTLGLGLRYNF